MSSLKHWQPGFNPLMDTLSGRFLWIILPDFSLELWSVHIFTNIAILVGRFVYFEEKSLRWNNKRLAWVLVEMDLEMGFPNEIERSLGDASFMGSLDYW